MVAKVDQESQPATHPKHWYWIWFTFSETIKLICFCLLIVFMHISLLHIINKEFFYKIGRVD